MVLGHSVRKVRDNRVRKEKGLIKSTKGKRHVKHGSTYGTRARRVRGTQGMKARRARGT